MSPPRRATINALDGSRDGLHHDVIGPALPLDGDEGRGDASRKAAEGRAIQHDADRASDGIDGELDRVETVERHLAGSKRLVPDHHRVLPDRAVERGNLRKLEPDLTARLEIAVQRARARQSDPDVGAFEEGREDVSG